MDNHEQPQIHIHYDYMSDFCLDFSFDENRWWDARV